MNRITTQSSSTMQSEIAAREGKQQPRMSTLAFLKQFARSYHYEASIRPAALGGMIVN